MQAAETLPFYSAVGAMRWGFGVHGAGCYAPPLMSRMDEQERDPLRPVRFPGLSPLERHGEAAFILRLVEQSAGLNPLELHLVAALYLVPHDADLERKKAIAIGHVAEGLAAGRTRPKAFVEDMVGRFCGERSRRKDREWVQELGVSMRTIETHRPRIFIELEEIHERALVKIEARMRETGRVAS